VAGPQEGRPRCLNSVVVDTDIISFIFKNHPIGALYEADLAGRTLLVSFMTVAELDRWAIQSKWVAAQSHGRRIECANAWIAATALRHDVPLVTHNAGHYQGVPGLKLISHGS